MRRTLIRTAVTALLLAAVARADVYSDGTLTVDFARTGDDYAGTFALAGQAFPAKARLDGERLTGTFQSGGTAFDFTATSAGDTLTLTTGGKTYTLKRKDAPANPLAAAANPLATPATAPAGLPAGYTVATRAGTGLAVTATKPAAAGVSAALSAVLPDVAELLDGRPTVTSAVEDQQTRGAGFANFTGTKNGKPVRGVISCRTDEKGCQVKVVYADAAALAEDWQKLNAEQTAVSAAADKVAMRPYRFPDGTGTIGVPDGWRTQTQSILDPIVIEGPDDAKLILNGGLLVNTPDSQIAQMVRQNEQQARQMGIRPIEYPGYFAEFGPPVRVLQAILPKVNEQKRRANRPTGTIDKMITVLPARPQLPDGNAQDMEYTWTLGGNGTDTPMRSVVHAEVAPLGPDAFYFQVSELMARQTDFATAQPTMVAILNSAKPDPDRVARVQAQRAEAQRQQAAQQTDAILRQGAESRARLNAQFEAGQVRHRDQVASYDRSNHNWAVNQNLQARSHDNFIEYLGGTRDVVDTTTGQRRTYDLSDANAVAQSLNDAAGDANRFKAIPLRDERDPLIGN